MTRYRQTFKFLLSLLAALALTWAMREPSYSQAQTYVLFLLWFSVGLWLTEAVPPFAVGSFILAYLAFTLGIELFAAEPQDVGLYLNTLSSSVIWLMMGGLFLASAMTKTRLDADLVRVTMRVYGADPRRVLFGLMAVTMVFSMLISNTATTAMVLAALMPLLVTLGKESPVARGLGLGIPIAATTGGMGTVLGSPPNAVTVGALATAGRTMDFVTWIFYGLPIALFLTWLSWRVLVRVSMKHPESLAVDGAASARPAVTREFRAQRLAVMAILLVTLVLWFTSPIHRLSAAAVSAVPLVFLPMNRILKGKAVRAIGSDTLKRPGAIPAAGLHADRRGSVPAPRPHSAASPGAVRIDQEPAPDHDPVAELAGGGRPVHRRDRR
jgi:sodium-dependent dicarboxylate transporter 2/3/5